MRGKENLEAFIDGSQIKNKTRWYSKVRGGILHMDHDISRAWQTGLPTFANLHLQGEVPSMIAVGSGKGGVGKSTLSANLAAKLGQAGQRVLLMDLDIGGANLHTYFGLPAPAYTLADYVVYNRVPFERTLQPTPIANVLLAIGGKEEVWSELEDLPPSLFTELWKKILSARTEHNIDVVIFDLGAGTQKHTIDFFSSAHLGILTVVPEPTSIENAYSFLKTVLWRLVDHTGMRTQLFQEAAYIKEYLFQNPTVQKNYRHKFQELQSVYPFFMHELQQLLCSRKIGMVMNQVRCQKDIEIYRSMCTIVPEYFGYTTQPLGYMHYDDAAWKSLRNRRLVVTDFPHSLLARKINSIAAETLSSLPRGSIYG
jgi:flagellar biosynthesis protein FlhG